MSCCQYFEPVEGGASTFTVAMPRLTFGVGALDELGVRVAMRGLSHVALFTDAGLKTSEHLARARASLQAAGVSFEEFSEVAIEPDDTTCSNAAEFYSESNAQAAVAVGGGSVIDTAKAAVVYATHPAPFTDYFGAPVGDGVPIPASLPPVIACPTTGGTGSEATAVSVVRINALGTKFVLQSPAMLPVEAIIDPLVASTLPTQVVASSGFDLLSHAIESYTARAYSHWPEVADPAARPTVQGANPWSDNHAREALRLVSRYLERGVKDATDTKARGQLMWGAALAGMAFGNTGTHLPHAFSYGVSHLNTQWRAQAYPDGDGAFVPHGIAVMMTAPSVFRHVAASAPQRHIEASECLGGGVKGAGADDAGEVIATRMIELMRATDIPNGLKAIGFVDDDANALMVSASRQKRAIANAPGPMTDADIEQIYRDSMTYWS